MRIALFEPEIAGNVGAVLRLAAEHTVEAHAVGETWGQALAVQGAFELSLDALRAAWEGEE